MKENSDKKLHNISVSPKSTKKQKQKTIAVKIFLLEHLLHVYYKTEAEFGSIMGVGALTRCALLHSVWDLKAVQTNVKIICELVVYVLKLGQYAAEDTKNIYCVKGKVDHSIKA